MQISVFFTFILFKDTNLSLTERKISLNDMNYLYQPTSLNK